MKPRTFRELPTSAQDTILFMADRIRDGFTGTIRIELLGGGVRSVTEERRFNARQLARLREDRTG